MQSMVKPMVRGCYDIQKLRIETGNRIVANFKAKLGQAPGEKESEIDTRGKFLLKTLRSEHKRITDGVKRITLKTFKGCELLSTYVEYCLVTQYQKLLDSEKQAFKDLGVVLKTIPVYTDFLVGVKGVGPAMAGVIVSEIDIHKANYPSSLWRYSGLDVAGDGDGRSRRKEHLVDVEYTNKNGEISTRKGITFNPFLKTKLCGVLGPSFLKAGKDNKYAQAYYNYKFRIENHPSHKDKSKGHRNNMAIRYMVKRFLVDLYIAWREMEGLPVADEYSVAKLGMVHKEVYEKGVVRAKG